MKATIEQNRKQKDLLDDLELSIAMKKVEDLMKYKDAYAAGFSAGKKYMEKKLNENNI